MVPLTIETPQLTITHLEKMEIEEIWDLNSSNPLQELTWTIEDEDILKIFLYTEETEYFYLETKNIVVLMKSL